MAKRSVCKALWNKLQERPILDLHYDFSTSLYLKNHEQSPQSYNECRLCTRIDLLPCFGAGLIAAAVAGGIFIYRFMKKDYVN